MRLIAAAAAVVAVLGAVLLRLNATLGQLQTLAALPSATTATVAAVAETARETRSDAVTPRLEPAGEAKPAYATAPAADAGLDERPLHAASGGDAALLQQLAADPDFARAAEELLNDPDPQVQDDARQFLRELGATVQEPRAER